MQLRNSFQDVDFYFDHDAPVPRGRRRDRIVEGARAWTNARGRLMFRAHRTAPQLSGRGRCNRFVAGDPEPVGVVRWGNIDGAGSVLAFAGVCSVARGDGLPAAAASFFMRFDSSERWHFRSARGRPRPEQPDLRSVATHEMGHATGWSPHWDDDNERSFCQRNPNQQTMCRFNYPGTTWQRTLGARDQRIFAGAYP